MQSLTLGTGLLLVGTLIVLFGIQADISGKHRQLTQEMLYRLKKMELAKVGDQVQVADDFKRFVSLACRCDRRKMILKVVSVGVEYIVNSLDFLLACMSFKSQEQRTRMALAETIN